ncbi:HNH endonuclease [Candidatus Woesearchaeota archaeon]|nr:HNH endonuclease [Candidatus Woesearchaeota archaeon]
MGSVKSFSTDPAKSLWRERIVDFVRKHYTPHQIRNFRVLCFAGREMTEVFDVYDRLGVKRKNVVSLECDPREYDAMCAVNETLEQRIKIVPASALDYLSHPATQPFDVISLDYCGYFNDEKCKTLDRIAHNKWLAPHGVLITNYQKGRENQDVRDSLEHTSKYFPFEKDLPSMTAQEMGQLYLTIGEQSSGDFDITETRDRVIQVLPIQKMFNGTGFWNSPIYRTWMRSLTPDVQEVMVRVLADANDGRAKLVTGYLGRVFSESAPDDFGKTLLNIFSFLETRQQKVEAHEAYAYVSDSRTPMVSDFYLFGGIMLPFTKGQRLDNIVKYKLLKGKFVFDIRDRRKTLQLIQQYDRWHTENMDGFHRSALQPLDRIILEPERASFRGHNSETTRRNSKGGLRESIYVALSSNTPDAEIMQNYSLTKMELAGYKAAHTRQRNHAKTSPKGKGSHFPSNDLEVIAGLLEDGYKATEIVGLFEDDEGKPRYSWQLIAAYKATQTRINGTPSNERLFQQLKPEILERDGHACQWCHKSPAEQRGQSGHNFHVHHINYNHKDTRPDNLVTVCTSCHARTNTIQYGGEMKEYFELLMGERYPTATSA